MSRTPVATYRLQLHSEFGFDAAGEIAGYLEQLGISHVYSSPYLQAAPGSQHGYDVVDHHKVNEELGGSQAHDRFSMCLGRHHLGQVLDIVPNHMAISGRRNKFWWDVLENGPSSRYSHFFDIDWHGPDERLHNKLLVPVLGDHYGRVLERGELKIARRGGDFFVQYAEHEFPMAPRSLPSILYAAARETGSDYLAFLGDSLYRLPSARDTSLASTTERHRNKAVIGRLLERLFTETPFIAEAVDTALDNFSNDTNLLHPILEQQNFRLAFWQSAQEDLPYRRFFDVNTLVALRMEDPQVFAETHALILRWLREGVLDGIRIDHPDGLRDPKKYFERLRENAKDVWILAEKILETGEELRQDWPINGTTGYDFLNQAGGLFVDRSNEAAFNSLYMDFTGESTDYFAVCHDRKYSVLRQLLGSDVNRLTHLLRAVCDVHPEQRDHTQRNLARALRELVACFPVYRTYVVPESGEITSEDRHYIDTAINECKSRRPDLDAQLFDFIHDILSLRVRGPLESEFVMRFQQFCGPAMAKGVEDTAFYTYNRLVSLNEVGGDPGRFGLPPEDFHLFCERAQRAHPSTMLATSTHDTKRSEDVRARISLLSEMPHEWRRAVYRWAEMNGKYKLDKCPDRNTEYILYQTLVGAWPISQDRLLAYAQKVSREAKQQTSWIAPNEKFEEALKHFVEGICADAEFQDDLKNFAATLVEPGRVNSLSQALLKFTAPGIPDTYQGQELWDLSLVDPDNRRPVDYEIRRRLLDELSHLTVEDVMARADEGLPKLWLTFHALRVRRQYASAFGENGCYCRLSASGPKADHLVAYLRGERVAVFAPRLVWHLRGEWNDSSVRIPSGTWRNTFTGSVYDGGQVSLASVLSNFPVALLTRT